MTNQVIIVNEAEMTKVMNHYASSKVVRNAPGVVFAAKTPDTAITAYKSGKVLFQGAGASREAARWGETKTKASSAKPKTTGDTLPADLARRSVVGSDETGTGDFFGPVTVAACYVRADQIELVQELGVKDSKQLTDDLMRKSRPIYKQHLYIASSP